MTDSADAPLPLSVAHATPLGVPVVGMVGGGQLARMTSQAATGLGIACPRFAPVRTLAEAEAFADGEWPLVRKAVSGGYDG